MIKEILRMGGCKTEKEFLKKYPTEESFLEAFPQARPILEGYKNGGSLEAFPQARPMLKGYRDGGEGLSKFLPKHQGVNSITFADSLRKANQQSYASESTNIPLTNLSESDITQNQFAKDAQAERIRNKINELTQKYYNSFMDDEGYQLFDYKKLGKERAMRDARAQAVRKVAAEEQSTEDFILNLVPDIIMSVLPELKFVRGPLGVVGEGLGEYNKYKRYYDIAESTAHGRPEEAIEPIIKTVGKTAIKYNKKEGGSQLPEHQAQKSIVGRMEDWIDETGRSIGKKIANNSWFSEADVNKAGNAAGQQIQQTFTTYDPNKSVTRNFADKALAVGSLASFVPHPVTQVIGEAANAGQLALTAYDASQALLGQNYGEAALKGSKLADSGFTAMASSTNPLIKTVGTAGNFFNKGVTAYNAATALEKDPSDIKGHASTMKLHKGVPTVGSKMTMPGFKKEGGYVPAFPQQPTESQFFNYGPKTMNIPRLFKSGGMAFPQAPTEQTFFDYSKPTPNIPRLFQQGGQQQGNPLVMLMQQVTQQYNMDPNTMATALQKLPEEMLQDLTIMAETDPESAAQSLMELYQTESNQPIVQMGGVPTGGGMMEYKEGPYGTAAEEYGGSVFNYGQRPAILEKGGSIGMNKENTFLSDNLQKFVGKLNENATKGLLKEAEEKMGEYYGYKKGGTKKLRKHQSLYSNTGPRMDQSAGFVDFAPQIDPADITNASVTSSNIGDPNVGVNAGVGMMPGMGVMDPDVMNRINATRATQQYGVGTTNYQGPPSLAAQGTGPEEFDRSYGLGKYGLGEYDFQKDVDAYLKEKDSRAPSINAPGDEITKTYDLPKKGKLESYFDKQKNKWNKKSRIQKAETILNVGNRVLDAKQRQIENERQDQINERLYNPANWAAKYPVDRGKWDVNTAAIDPYRETFGNANMAAYGGQLPLAQSGLEIKMRAGLGFNANQLSWPVMAGEFSKPDLDVSGSLGPVDRDDATLEAEKDETAYTDLAGIGIPQLYNIEGKKHSEGGTPLDLPDNSFIFSEFMKLKDKDQLAMFGVNKTKRGGVSFADISKKFKINDHLKSLMSQESDELTRDTAQANIVNSNMKLGKLALIQESMKGFPDGVPLVSMPYLQSVGISPEQLAMMMPTGSIDRSDEEMGTEEARYGANVIAKMRMKKMGGLPKAQDGKVVMPESDPGFLGFGASSEMKFIRNQFDQALASNDSRNMRELAKALRLQKSEYNRRPGTTNEYDLEKYDISGSIPTGIGAFFSTMVQDLFNEGIDPKKTAFGFTEQDEAEDLADILENTANKLEVQTAVDDIYENNVSKIQYARNNIKTLNGEIANLRKNPDGLSSTELLQAIKDKERDRSNYINYLTRYSRAAGIKNVFDENDTGDIMTAMAQSPLQQKVINGTLYAFGENTEGNLSNEYRNRHTMPSYQDWYNKNKLQDDRQTGRIPDPVGPDTPVKPTKVQTIPGDLLKNWKSYSDQDKVKKAKDIGYNVNEINAEWWRVNQPNIVTWINAVNEGRNKISDVPEVYKTYVEKELVGTPVKSDETKKSMKGDKSRVKKSTSASTVDYGDEGAEYAKQQRERLKNMEGAERVFRHGGPLDKFIPKYQWAGPYSQYPTQSRTTKDGEYLVILPNKDFQKFGTQSFDANKGYYTVTNPETNEVAELPIDDFITRQSGLLENYKSSDGKTGIDAWKADALSKNDKTRRQATRWFQTSYNDMRTRLGDQPYFFGDKGPYTVDEKLGIYTWSAPGYAKTKTPPPGETPKPRYICKDNKVVTVTDGSGYETANEAMMHCGDDSIKPGPGLTPQQQPIGSDFWTEDVINTGAALRNLGDIQKYLPWQAVAPFYAAQPTFESPERAIGAVGEALTTGTQGAAAFGDAQGYGAVASSMMGDAAANTANVIADVNNRNVQTANQFELTNKQAYNAYLQNQADRATNMYDKTVIANQQFDNARREAKDEMRKQFVNAWTNRGKTQTLNAMYSDQYYTDPRTGYTYLTNPRNFEYTEPTYDNMPDYLKKIYDQSMAKGDYNTALEAYNTWKEITTKKNKQDKTDQYATARNIRGVTDVES